MDSAGHYSEGPPKDCGGSGVRAVTEPPGDVLALEGSLLCRLDSLEDLARWRDEVINQHRQVILGGSAVIDVDGPVGRGDRSRVALPVASSTLEELLAAGFDRMRENGELADDADPARLATGLTAALQGGSLLARTTRDVGPLEAALDVALSCVGWHSSR